MGVKILEDGSYDLRGASEEEVGGAIDHYFDITSNNLWEIKNFDFLRFVTIRTVMGATL